MNAIIKPSKSQELHGTVWAPTSKSYTHRAVVLASLAYGRSIIEHPLLSDDTLHTIKACQQLGVAIQMLGDTFIIDGVDGHFPQKKYPIRIDCGESGTTMRLMLAVAGLSQNNVQITGASSSRKRPMDELITSLKLLGVNFINTSPLTIYGGKIRGGKLKISGERSSQFISALLLIAPYGDRETEIKVSHLSSSPYVDVTIDVMRVFGVEVEKKKNKYFVKAGQHYKSTNFSIEGDYSSASYFLALKALTKSNISVTNLKSDSLQGDKIIIEILRKMSNNKLDCLHIDLGDNPDLVPIVSILAAFGSGNTVIENIAHLKFKESNRIKTIEENLIRMCIRVSKTKDSLTIYGGHPRGTIINTFNDHRIAMSFAVAGLCASGKTIIKNAEVVNKSYPNFWKDLKHIEANVTLV